jgi:hypothetical protein
MAFNLLPSAQDWRAAESHSSLYFESLKFVHLDTPYWPEKPIKICVLQGIQ